MAGIIPAYAGNTQVHMAWRVPLRDHPRVCGEHMLACGAWDTRMGSSPRMRGTLEYLNEHGDMAGIIPAYAGNTFRLPQHG